MKVRTIHNMLVCDAQWLRSVLEFASQAGFPSRLSGDAFWEWWATDLDSLEERSKMEVRLLGYPENVATFWLRCVYVAKPDGSVPQSWLTVDCPAPLLSSDWEGSLRQAQDDFQERFEFEAKLYGKVSDADMQFLLRLSMGEMDEDEATLSRAVRTINGFTIPRGIFVCSTVEDATRRAAKLLSLSPPRVANWLCCFSTISGRSAAQPFIAGFPQCEFQIICPRLLKPSYMQERIASEARMEFSPLTCRLERTKVVYEVPLRFASERANKVALPSRMVNPHPILSQKHHAKVGRSNRDEQIAMDVKRFKFGEVDFEALVREEWQREFDQNGDLALEVKDGLINAGQAKTRIYWRVKRRLAKGGAKPLKLSPGWRSRLQLPGSLEI